MKFRRILAAILSVLMIASVMSFSAFVSAADDGIIKYNVSTRQNFKAERGKTSVNLYEEETGIVFSRMTPNITDDTMNSSCYINIGGQSIMPTAEQIADDTVYLVFYVRTNMELDGNDNPFLHNYNTYWGTAASNVKIDGSNKLVTDNSNFDVKVGNEWSKICFKLDTKKEVTLNDEKVVAPIYKWDQLAFLAVGTNSTNPIKDWEAKAPAGEAPNMDCAGYVITSTLAAAEDFDFEKAAAAPTYTVKFDKGYTADDDTDVETVEGLVETKYTGEYLEFPELTAPADGYELVGWFSDAECTTPVGDTEAVEITGDATYYALWQDNSVPVEFSLDSLTINGSKASDFGVTDINAEEIIVTLPYGWEALEDLGVMPDVVPTATSPATAVYVAPETLADAGKIVFTQGKVTDEVAISFVIADAPETKIAGTGKVGSGVYSTTGPILLPDGTEINKDNKIRAVGVKSEKNVTHYGVKANKVTPIYKDSELDGTKVSDTEYYSSNRSTNLEGYDVFGIFDYESFNAYRALVYYDTGADGKFDVEVNPRIYYQAGGTTGTMNTNDAARRDSMTAKSPLKGNRWEYIYFTKTELNKVLYGKARQPAFCFFGKDDSTRSYHYTDDFFYFAQIEMLAECPELVYYKPTTVRAESADGDIPGYIEGVTDDMEFLADGEWTAVTELENYENGVIKDLVPGEYSVRYASDDIYEASEATVLEILPGAVSITFDAQNGDAAETYEFAIGTDITAPADPVKNGYLFKGWAEEADGEVIDLASLKATEDKTYYAVWKKIEVVYVKSTAEEGGNGYSADSPVKTLAKAAEFAYNYGGTIVIMDDVAWPSKINGENNYNHVNADVTITSVDPVTGTDYPGALVQTTSLNFAGDFSKKITIRDIEIASWRFGSASDKWQYINFRGHPIEFENITARVGEVPVGYSVGGDAVVDDANKEKFFPLHMRAQGEAADKGYGHKIVLGETDFSSMVLGGKVPYSESTNWYKYDIDLVFNGGNNSDLGVGNDSNVTTKDGKRYFSYGRLDNVKLLFETAPKSIYMTNISGIDGTYRVIANNGAVVTIPAFTYTRTDDVTTNADGSAYTADLTPKGGFWKINSAEGGRVDFTEEDNVFAVTTDAAYIVVTNKADGTSRKIRVADGAEGDANLFDDGAYLLTLEAGEYDIAYTNEAVKIDVTFENGDADETYTLAKGEAATFAGTVTAPAGKVFAGWESEDGTIAIEGNTYTADTYYADGIVLYPVFADDASVPYYYIYGEYDRMNGKYTATVKIANGKFAAGTFGLEYNTLALELADDGMVMGEGVQNYLGNDPEITKVEPDEGSGLAMIVWNAASGIVDASENEVTLATFTFDVIDTDQFDVFFGGNVDGWFNVSSYDYNNWEFDEVYEKYYNGEYYLVSPENTSDNPYAVDYVPVYFGDIVDKEKSYEKASITFNITFDSKEGASAANIGELVLWGEDGEEIVYTIGEEYEEETVTITVEDFYADETVYFYIHKNGYLAFEDSEISAADGTVVNVTLLGGDIKGAAEDCCGDGEITLADFVRVVRAFDENVDATYEATVDITEDGVVNVNDLSVIKTNFGKTSADNTIEIVNE